MVKWYDFHAVRRRAATGRAVVFLVFGVLLLAFFRVQVLSSARYQLQSETNRLRQVAIPAPRGLIVDRNGAVLAENVPGYSVALLAASEDSLKALLRRLAPLVGLDPAAQELVIRRYRRRPAEPVLVRRDAPFELVSALEERRAWIPGLVVQSEPKRRYPYGEIAAHVVGYVGEVTEGELESGRHPSLRPGQLVGRDGIEAQYDRYLRGRDGAAFVEVDALGRTVRDARHEERLPPQPGDTIRTTIDIALQQYVHEIFPRDWRGAVVALEPATGDVLALYSAPSYDPNEFVGGLERERWNALRSRADYPLLNRAIQARYPPASPWKLVVAAMALKRGVAAMDTRMPSPCTGGLQYYNRYFRCWHVAGHGSLTLSEAIQHSCDVYFYQLGLKLNLTNMLHDGVAMGFRDLTGIDLPDEKQPIYPPSTEYFNRKYGPRGWTNAVALNLAIGQGENAQTLVSMVRFYAMLGNPDGRAPEPRVVPALAPPALGSVGLSPEDLDGLRNALEMVVSRGTAAGARIASLRIAGKTGTAQNPHGPDHGWFIAFAPVDQPRIVVGAVVEFGEHGSTVARLVNPIIAYHMLGARAGGQIAEADLVLPADSAPEPTVLVPGGGGVAPGDTARGDAGTR